MRKKSTVMIRIRIKIKLENSLRIKLIITKCARLKPEIHAILSGNGGGFSNL
jgi:hypothetical protein